MSYKVRSFNEEVDDAKDIYGMNSPQYYAALNKKSQALKAQRMKNDMVTPSNIGFPFIDTEVTNKIFRWNLGQLLTRGYSDSIQGSGSDRYVMYNGFKCYVDRAYITKLSYYIIDPVGDTSTKAKNYLRDYINLETYNQLNNSGASGDENNYIVIVGVEYEIPITYVGITPMKSIFEYVWNKEVHGLDETKDGVSDHPMTMVEDIDTLTGGGIDGDESSEGLLTTFGEVYYTLIR